MNMSHPVSDAIVSILWIVENWLLAVSAWRAANRFAPSDGTAGKVLHSTILFCGAITAIMTGLGAVGLLSGPAILMTTAVFVATLLAAFRRESARHAVDAPSRNQSLHIRPAWIATACLLAAHCLLDGILKFPTDFDCLMYHLPLVDHWLQSHSLYAPQFVFWSVPGGSELLAAWCCAPFSGDFLAPLNNLPIVVMWAAAGLELARLLGMAPRWRSIAVVAVVAVYTLLHETDDASNDLMVVACFLAASVYAVRSVRTPDNGAVLALWGVALGLLAGVKLFALEYAAAVWTVGVGVTLSLRGPRSAIRAAATSGAMCALFGGYWYVRNWAATGLPFFPMGAVGEISYPSIWSSSLWGSRHAGIWPLLFHAFLRMGGPFHVLGAGLSPIVCSCLLVRSVHLIRGRHSRTGEAFLVVSLLMVLAAIILLTTPFLVEDEPGTQNHLRWGYTPLRYGLCFLSLSIVTLLALVNHCLRTDWGRGRQYTLGLLSLMAAGQVIQRAVIHSREFDFLAIGACGLLFAMIVWVYRDLIRSLRSPSRAFLRGAMCVAVAANVSFLSSRWHAGFHPHFSARLKFRPLERLNAGDARRLCVLADRTYPFFGSNRQNRVVTPRRYVADSWFEQFLQKGDCDYVVAYAKRNGTIDRYRGVIDFLDRGQDGLVTMMRSGPWRLIKLSSDHTPGK